MKINKNKLYKQLVKIMMMLSVILSVGYCIYNVLLIKDSMTTEYVDYLIHEQAVLKIKLQTINNQLDTNTAHNYYINTYNISKLKEELQFIKVQYKETSTQLNYAMYGPVIGFHVNHPVLTLVLFPIFIVWYVCFCWPVLAITGVLGWLVWFIWYGFIFYYSVHFLEESMENREKEVAITIMTF